ncbi:MAG: hypothetical protein ABI443_11455 [Chthoniobacterales bacterium]
MKATSLFLIASLCFILNLRANDFYDYQNQHDSDPFNVGTPSVPRRVEIGGFKLKIDHARYGINIFNAPKENLLGVFQSDDHTLKVLRIPNASSSLEQEARKMSSAEGWPLKEITEVQAQGGLHGVRITYGGASSMFSKNVRVIRYLFVNPQGETICFEANARNKRGDWSYIKFLMYKELSPAKNS